MKKIFFSLCLCVLAVNPLLAQERKRRIALITLEPAEHKLTWVVANTTGEVVTRQGYEITFDDRTMRVNGEARRFSAEEGTQVLAFLEALHEYTIDSVIWWEAGKGEPVEKKEKAGGWRLEAGGYLSPVIDIRPPASAPRSSERAPQDEYVQGCPLCCCEVKIPRNVTKEQALAYCMRSMDTACKEMCRRKTKRK